MLEVAFDFGTHRNLGPAKLGVLSEIVGGNPRACKLASKMEQDC
jgi:hypothetical protein